MAKHECTQAKRIEKLEKQAEETIKKLARIETQNESQNEKLDTIIKTLHGNGRPGLVDEINEMRGANKTFKWIVSVGLTCLGIIVAAMVNGVI